MMLTDPMILGHVNSDVIGFATKNALKANELNRFTTKLTNSKSDGHTVILANTELIQRATKE